MGMSDLEKKIAGHADEAQIKADFLAVVEGDLQKLLWLILIKVQLTLTLLTM